MKINPNDKHSMQIGHFTMSSGAGCGCDHNGVAVLNGNKAANADTQPNKSLIEYEKKWWNCGGADADLVQADGITYVDAWGGNVPGRETPPRVLLQLARGAFQPICRIDQVLSITPKAYTVVPSRSP